MDYEVSWEGSVGFYARFTGWVTPESAARIALELTSDPRYIDLRYAIIDFSVSPGHRFRRDDRNQVGNAMVQAIGAGMSNRNILEIAIATDPRMLSFLRTYASLTSRPFFVFDTLPEARRWLADRAGSVRPPQQSPAGIVDWDPRDRTTETGVTEWLFQQDAYLKSCQAQVIEATADGVVLDRTVFYPLGGGQPGDTGLLRGSEGREWRVLDTRKGEGGRILHKLSDESPSPAPGEAVEAVLDWERRYRHMRMHTGLHLLGSVLRFGVTGGQVAADRSRLDFDTQDEIDVAQVNDALQRLADADRPVSCRWITDEELDRQPELVRTLSVQPPRGAGRIRLLEIADIDLQPCGGTHVRATGEVGRLVVTKVENKGRHNKRVYVTFA